MLNVLYDVAVQVCPHAKGVHVKMAFTFLYKIKFKNISFGEEKLKNVLF